MVKPYCPANGSCDDPARHEGSGPGMVTAMSAPKTSTVNFVV